MSGPWQQCVLAGMLSCDNLLPFAYSKTGNMPEVASGYFLAAALKYTYWKTQDFVKGSARTVTIATEVAALLLPASPLPGKAD